jgi:hypothetical protein
MEFEPLSMSPEDLQLLATRTFNIQEIARWFSIPVMKLQEHSHSTYSNVSELQRIYATDCIRPWLERWESAIQVQLLSQPERRQLFAKHRMDAILRGDMESRNRAYDIMRRNGVLSANEWRKFEEMNSIPDIGDDYWQPLNMIKAGSEPVKLSQEVPPEPEQKKQPIPESRSMRSLTERRRIAEVHKEGFRIAARAILKKDRLNVLKIAKANLGERTMQDFRDKIDTYFMGNYKFIHRQISNAYLPFATAIYPVAAQEVNAVPEPTERYNEEVGEFINNVTSRYISEGRREIQKLAEKAQSEEKDPTEAIEKRLDEWDEKKPDRMANREAVDGESGLATHVYWANGFKTRWVTMGDSCPYCNALNGRVISSGGMFLGAGEAFEPAGAVNGPLRVHTTVRHPAAHMGCDCSVMASL